MLLVAVAALILVALVFDYINGFHDAANSIATVVSTRVLSPRYAVIWAAFFNFIAFLFFGLHVAQTIGVGIVAADVAEGGVTEEGADRVYGVVLRGGTCRTSAPPALRSRTSRSRHRMVSAAAALT